MACFRPRPTLRCLIRIAIWTWCPIALARPKGDLFYRNLSKSFGRSPKLGDRDAWTPSLLAPCKAVCKDLALLGFCHSVPLEVLTRAFSPPLDTVPTNTKSTITKPQWSHGPPKGGSSLHRATARPTSQPRLYLERAANQRASRR